MSPRPARPPAGLRLELTAAVGLLVAALDSSDPDAVLAAVGDGPSSSDPLGTTSGSCPDPGAPGDRFLRIALASLPLSAGRPDPTLGRACWEAIDGAWIEAVAVQPEPAMIEALFSAYRATVRAVSRRAELPVGQVHALVAVLCRRARDAALEPRW